MKTIGLIGGMSWESTASYYAAINRGINKIRGGHNCANIILNSINFAPIEECQRKGDWDGTARILSNAARDIQAAGADFLLICTNTMHRVADQVQAAVDIPLLHIADATAQALIDKNIQKVGLLGTAFTMEQDFYKGRLETQFGLEVLVPDNAGRQSVHTIIYDQLCRGIIADDSRTKYLDIIQDLSRKGAQGVILGCTEIGLLVKSEHTRVPLFDTALIHAGQAVARALSP